MRAKETLGVILAGGRSSRMGGSDKALLNLNGITLIQNAINRLEPQTDALLINTNSKDAGFNKLGHPILPDSILGFAGPLAGILTGLEYAAENGYQKVITIAVDTPFFPNDFATNISSCESEIAIAASGGYPQPTFGCWNANMAKPLRVFLSTTDERKVMLFVRAQNWAKIDFDHYSSGLDPFFNINTQDDLKEAEKHHTNLSVK